MFVSFFPSPRLFFWSAAIWSLVAIAIWYLGGSELGSLIGLENPPAGAPPVIGAQVFVTKPFLWFYIYYALVTLPFAAVWYVLGPHPWYRWSVLGTALIVFFTYFLVQISVALNKWYGPFYDLIQRALSKPGAASAGEFYEQLLIFTGLATVFVLFRPISIFFVSHYVFRWRTAMNSYYTQNWPRLRQVEGAAQRVQEDTMRFARIVEGLGASFVEAVMTLVAFLPVLHQLESHIAELPVVGVIPYPLVTAAILWSILGTGFVAAIGALLPGLEFRNQRVEAAYRKELVYGEDHEDRAQPQSLLELFSAVKKNYFKLYFHYIYFNVGRFVYVNADTVFSLIILVPSMVAARFTLGVFQQINHAFDKVRESFQYLVSSWSTIIDLISIYKRLRAFESTIHGDPLSPIEFEPADAKT